MALLPSAVTLTNQSLAVTAPVHYTARADRVTADGELGQRLTGRAGTLIFQLLAQTVL
jgi:hypothetical protein